MHAAHPPAVEFVFKVIVIVIVIVARGARVHGWHTESSCVRGGRTREDDGCTLSVRFAVRNSCPRVHVGCAICSTKFVPTCKNSDVHTQNVLATTQLYGALYY